MLTYIPITKSIIDRLNGLEIIVRASGMIMERSGCMTDDDITKHK
jgi:hypothetical protein